jgi:hypothetical protein
MNHSSRTSILGQGRWWHGSLLSGSLYALLPKHHFITSNWCANLMFNTWESIQTNSIFDCNALPISLQTQIFVHISDFGKLVVYAGTRYRLWLHARLAGSDDWQGPTEPTSDFSARRARQSNRLLACEERDRLFHWCYRSRHSTPAPHKPTNAETRWTIKQAQSQLKRVTASRRRYWNSSTFHATGCIAT